MGAWDAHAWTARLPASWTCGREERRDGTSPALGLEVENTPQVTRRDGQDASSLLRESTQSQGTCPCGVQASGPGCVESDGTGSQADGGVHRSGSERGGRGGRRTAPGLPTLTLQGAARGPSERLRGNSLWDGGHPGERVSGPR